MRGERESVQDDDRGKIKEYGGQKLVHSNFSRFISRAKKTRKVG